MSSIGFPDGQRITQWLGAPIVQATARAIGNVLVEDGPYNLASWASVILAIKPTGGNVTATIRQKINGGPAGLELDETFVVAVGTTLFTSVVLFADTVYLDLTGSAPGVTVDYALYPANTTTNAQVLASANLNFQKNEVLVAAEPTLDFVDAGANTWTLTDDAPNTRMKVTPVRILTGRCHQDGTILSGSGFTVTRTAVGTYQIDFTVSFVGIPTVTAMILDELGAAEDGITMTTNSATRVTLETFNTATRAAVDQGFSFIAMQSG
jgi:hypothetical protein